jgi:hypothetical protein
VSFEHDELDAVFGYVAFHPACRRGELRSSLVEEGVTMPGGAVDL